MTDIPNPQPNEELPGSSPPPGSPDAHDEVGYDESEVSALGVNMILIAVAIVFAGTVLVGGAILATRKPPQHESSTSKSYSQPLEPKPASPRLDPLNYESANAPNVFAAQLEKERELHQYGNTAEERFVHIPIDVAIKLAPQSNTLHSRQGKLPDKAFGLVGGGEANSGRLYAEAPQWLQPTK